MKKHLLTFSLCIVLMMPAWSAKPISVNGFVYDYLSNDRNESQEQAEKHAVERAKQKVLEENFSIDVSSIVVTLDTESEKNGTYSTNSDFYSLGGTSVRGEWVTTTEEKILDSKHNGKYWEIKVRVSGTIREKSGTPIDLRYAVISQPSDRETRPRFFDNEDLLLRFYSPVDGALCVYLVDESKTAYCLLPYSSDGKGYAPVKANREHLFFSKAVDPAADELVMTTNKEIEHNILYIIFSPNTFTKAKDSKGGKNWRDQELPRNLPFKDFMHWLAKNQTADEQLVVRQEPIEIRK